MLKLTKIFFIFNFLLFLPLILLAGNSQYPIYLRIKPVFTVNVEKKIDNAQTRSKKNNMPSTSERKPTTNVPETYKSHCGLCHNTGLAGAPKLGDKAAWEPRIKQGLDVLIKHAMSGYKAMPAKGGCADCSQQQIKSAIEYMLSQIQPSLTKEQNEN